MSKRLDFLRSNLFDSIDSFNTSSTFYQQFLHSYSFAKKLQSQTVVREMLQKALLYEKRIHEMLMGLTRFSQKMSSIFQFENSFEAKSTSPLMINTSEPKR